MTSYFSEPAAGPEKPARRWSISSLLGREPPTVSEEEAFLTILMGAARADDVVSPEESQQITGLATRTRTLSKLTIARIAELRMHISEKIERDGLDSVVGAACLSIRNSTEHIEIKRMRCESVFAHAVDLIYADRAVTKSEQDYIDQVGAALEIDLDRGKNIAEIIKTKNSY
jgi:tellurite resistance protein